MRNRTALTLFLGLLFGISGAAYFKNKKLHSHRGPASLEGKRIPWIPTPAGKHLALIKVNILQPQVPENSVDETVIHGRILVNEDLANDLNYTWHLPEDVRLISGVEKDTLSQVKMGQIIDVSISVKGFSKETQKLISLQASSTRGELVLGGSAVLPSRPEDTMESVAPKMKKDADKQLGNL